MGNITMDKKKKERLDKICNAINKTQSETIQYMGGTNLNIERFPTGHPRLDDATGGGWPIGRFIELYGPESGGKTTICLHAIAEFQKKFPNDLVAMIDTEFSFDPKYADALGVNVEELLISQPASAELAMATLRNLITYGVRLVVVDSIAAMCPQAELDGEIGQAHVATLARVMTSSMKILTSQASKSNCTVFWTNQMREKIGVTYGAKTGTPGGRAVKHHMSVRVNVVRIGTERDGETAVANKTKIEIVKNKTAPPFKVADVSIVYGYGFDLVAGIFDAAVDRKIIKKSGGWFAYGEKFKIQGRQNVLEFLRANDDMFKEIEELISTPKEVKAEVKSDIEEKIEKIKAKKEITRKPVLDGDDVNIGVDDV